MYFRHYRKALHPKGNARRHRDRFQPKDRPTNQSRGCDQTRPLRPQVQPIRGPHFQAQDVNRRGGREGHARAQTGGEQRGLPVPAHHWSH